VPTNPEQVWCEELRHLLSQAVKRRLTSDVPLGIFLSGGIDSSAVLLFASQHIPPEKNKTFSIGFHEQSYDESMYARRVADLIGSDHYERILDIECAKKLIPDVLARLDEPLGDSSILPTYLLCRFARERVTVALGGDGGDELFAGYDTFKALNIAKWYNKFVPRRLHRGFRSLSEMLPKSDKNMSLDLKIRRSLRGISYPESVWNPVWLGALEPGEIEELFNEPTSYEELYEEAIHAWTRSTSDNLIDKTLEFYTRFYLQDDILTKADRASMMVSLEVRAPFLDNDVVEFARRIPHHFKYRYGETKYLLKRSLEDFLPRDILYRRKKGFGIPLANWMRKWEQPRFFPDVPCPNPSWISEKWSEHKDGRGDHRQFLWCWISLQHHFSGRVSN
jgi:asparagine synthase (glutamine-hydrolysing)